MATYPSLFSKVMAVPPGSPHPYVKRFGLIPPFFDVVGRVKSTSGYNKNPPRKNPIIEKWMLEESISCGSYGYAKGNTETSFNSTSKYSQSTPAYDEENFAKAWQMVAHSWSCVDRSYLAESYDEWFNMQTSPGYPFCLLHATKGEALADPVVRDWCDHCFDNFIFNGLWTCRCKKEPKKQAKIDANDTRVITASPIDVQAAAVRLFAQQNCTVYKAAREGKIPCTVGITKFRKGWHNLYNRLTRKGKFKQGMELDFTGFDGSCNPREFEQVMNLRFGLYTADLQNSTICRALKAYYAEVVHTKIVMDSGDVIQKHTGNPSGQINTIIDNCLINEFRWYYAWCTIMPPDYHSLESFKEHCELVTCGDDSVVSCSDAVLALFTPSKVFEVFLNQGWKPKFGLESGWQPIHTLSYCSSHFKWISGYVVPVPNNYQKLLASLLYGGERRSARETLSRLLGIKIETFFLTGFRAAIDRLVSEIFEKYYFTLRAAPAKDELSLSELYVLNRDFSAAFGLYLEENEEHSHVPYGPVKPFDNSHIVDIL